MHILGYASILVMSPGILWILHGVIVLDCVEFLRCEGVKWHFWNLAWLCEFWFYMFLLHFHFFESFPQHVEHGQHLDANVHMIVGAP